MRKLSLHPDQLCVESFAPQEAPAGRGTVAAHAGTALDCRTNMPPCGTVMRMSCYAGCTDPEFC
jgi:hypothetical protein